MKILLILTLTFHFLLSAPALNIQREFTQSDGSRFKARAVGDQYLNWLETEDGEVLKYNIKSKNFEYAIIKNYGLKASGTRFQQTVSKRTRSITRVNKIDKKELHQLWAKKRKEAHHKKGF